MHPNKVEICGVNTAKLKVLPAAEKRALLQRVKDGDMRAREELIGGNLKPVLEGRAALREPERGPGRPVPDRLYRPD